MTDARPIGAEGLKRPAGGMVASVTGPVTPASLGIVDAHDHLFLASAALPGVELDDEKAAAGEVFALREAGGGTLVQWSPAGTRRRLDALRRISQAIGVTIVAATGRHLAAHYRPGASITELDVDRLTALFVEDITRHGCGLIKVGTDYWGPGVFDALHLEAAVHAASITGVPIAVHLERGTAAIEVLEHLARHGHPTERVILGHLGRFPDECYIHHALESGAYACLDAPSLGNHATDWHTPALIEALTTAGHGDQLMIGANTTSADAQPARGGAPGTSNLLRWATRHLAPRFDNQQMQRILVDNPARAFTTRA